MFLKFLIVAGSFFLIHKPSEAQISNPSGGLTQADPALIWAQTLEGNYFNEFWNYQFYFDNGMKVHIVFSAANFGSLKSPVSGVRVSVFNPDGGLYQLSREYSIDWLVQDKENHRYQLHPEREVYFEGELPNEHRIVINTSKDGVHYDIDLRLNNIQRGYKWDDGLFSIHNEKIGIITHIPYAEASGRVSINGSRGRVNGTAYMDHTYQYQTTTRLMQSGFRFVYHESPDNWDIFYFLLPENNRDRKTVGYRLVRTNGQVSLKGIKNIKQVHQGRAFNSDIPRIVELNLENGSEVRIARTDDQERFSILSELGWLARRAARSFLGGEVVDFRGEASLQESSQRPKQGDYNFFFVK